MSPLLGLSLEQLQHRLIEKVPQNSALGMRVAGCAKGEMIFDLPFQPNLVGDPLANVIHEGAITTLIDTTAGSVLLTQQDEPCRPATLDLRIDYLRRARPGQTLRCIATCERMTEHMALVRAIVHDGDAGDLVAMAVASFAVFRAQATSAA